MRIMLVYQGGFANVFKVRCFNTSPYGREAVRLLQGDFVACRWFARGAGAAGAIVRTAWCDKAGDITNGQWAETSDGQPFSDDTLEIVLN